VVQSSRAARVTRIIRVLRIMRLTRIVKLYKQAKLAQEKKMMKSEKVITFKRRGSSIMVTQTLFEESQREDSLDQEFRDEPLLPLADKKEEGDRRTSTNNIPIHTHLDISKLSRAEVAATQ